jgi:hypothetical protein
MKLRIVLLIAGLVLLFIRMYSSEQTAYMVWNSSCIIEVTKDSNTRIIAPMIAGLPDMSKARLERVHATYTPSCGVITVSRPDVDKDK